MAIVQSSILSRLKLIVVPVLLIISLTYTDAYAQKVESKIKKIAIDAGHGGENVPGAVGKVYKEKDIVLGVALRLGRFVEANLPEVEVVYTRKKDIDVPLHERSDIANKAEVDLFISIHANSVANTLPRGTETWVMGMHKSQENLEVAMRENAVIQYEDGYEDKYEMFDPTSPESYIIFSLMQNTYLEKSIRFADLVQKELKGGSISIDRGIKQGPFLVLWRTAAPSVLIEIGFISNIVEEQLLGDIDVQQEIAESIFRAVKKYKDYMDGIVTVDDDVVIRPDTVVVEKEKEVAAVELKDELKKEKDTKFLFEETKPETPAQNTPNQPKNYKWITN